jgi:hypothetical protein
MNISRMDAEEQVRYVVTVELGTGAYLGFNLIGRHLRETWRNTKDGGIERPGGLPPIVGYDPDTHRRIYRAWPDKDGNLCWRENGLPSEINETEDEAHMMWYSPEGYEMFIAEPTDVRRNPKTGEIIEFIYNDPAKPCTGTYINYEPPSLDFLAP